MLNSMQRLSVLILGGFEILSWCSLTDAACYFPNGIDMKIPDKTFDFSLCDSSTEFSMCCAVGNDCRPDKLCFMNSTGLVYRKGCTDPTWTSPSCVKLCYSGIGTFDFFFRI